MQSHFEITVSFRGVHLFATHPRSLTDEAIAYALWDQLKEKFPLSGGYRVVMTYWEGIGHPC